MKRLVSVMLVIMMISSTFLSTTFSLTAEAAVESIQGWSGDCKWKVVTTPEGSSLSTILTIEAMQGNGKMANYDDMKVWWGTNITKVIIGEGVTSIGDFLFANCTKLTSVSIPSTVKTIGESAFANCTALNYCPLRKGVVTVKKNAFAGCRFSSVTIPESVTTVGGFANCTKLTSVSIPSTVKTIGESAFEGCSNLTEVTMSSGVTSIADSTFYWCKKLAEITIPNSVTSIADYAFVGCETLTEITIPSGVTSIGISAFKDCSKLTNVIIPNSVTSIGSSAFRECSNLTEITIPSSLASIGIKAFGACPSVVSIEVDGENQYYYSRGNCIIDKQGTLVVGCKESIIPEEVKTIATGAFYGCTGLRSIEIPDGVTSIKVGAFEECTGLVSMKIPFVGTYASIYGGFLGEIFGERSYNWTQDRYTYEEYEFYNMYVPSSLESIEIGGGCSEINEYAFRNCYLLKSIEIPTNVEAIEYGAFFDCIYLTDIWYHGTAQEKNDMEIHYQSFDTNANVIWHYNTCKDEHVYKYDCDASCENCDWTRELGTLESLKHNFILNANSTCYGCGISRKPSKPIVANHFSGTVELDISEGMEYSKDGELWQTSNVFSGLADKTTYTFYQRVKASSIAQVSEVSEGVTVYLKMTQSRPTAPTVSNYTDTTVKLIQVEGVEYSWDGITWQQSNVFDNLSSGTKYTFYQRYAETDTYEASASSAGTSVTTDKSKQTLIPNAPVVQSVSASSITLVPVEGCEYSKNGTTWQSSNVFSNLSCGTEHTFYQRYKETSSTYVGKSSEGTIGKTDKGTQSAPSKPTLSKKTHDSVTLVEISGYEYSMDGITWQTSNVFTGLNPETNYLFYQRKAETDTRYASASSISLTVKTDEEPQYITGDFNNDNAVTDADALYLLYHTIFGDSYPIEQDCDYNHDGSVTDADALYLLYHTIFGDTYPLN